jgi:hypothetical protein
VSAGDVIDEEKSMIATDAQVRKLMEELNKHGKLGVAALRAGIDRGTAAKYRDAGKFPSELKAPRTWRTREDPFDEVWPVIVSKLEDAPEFEAKTLFEWLLTTAEPGTYEPGQLRTLQRRVREWRATSGPDKEVFFAQLHKPGDAMQTDFTWATELEITIAGVPLPHLLCHPVLPYSNWEWVTVCQSESMAAIKRGVQAALFQLGRVPTWHQTDNSTAATHDLADGKRGFNDDYRTFIEHFGMKPRTIEIGKSNQNGDVEALNGALKRRLKQHLLVRGSRDFESVEFYEVWLQQVVQSANHLRQTRISEEVAVMRLLAVERLKEHTEEDVLVTGWSTIRVKNNAYSVPSRLIGEWVRVHLYDDKLDVRLGETSQLVVERLHGRNGHRINYRHIIWSLVQKPWAFAQYRYREELFPSLVFRKAYDALLAKNTGRAADIEYLRVLHLAASTMESEVELVLEKLLAAGTLSSADQVKAATSPARPHVPVLETPEINLHDYDALLGGAEAAS